MFLVGDTCLRILPGRPTWNGMTVWRGALLVVGFDFPAEFAARLSKEQYLFLWHPTTQGRHACAKQASPRCAVKVNLRRYR
ncbi:MAG: hypothetical protein ACMVP2_04610 [Imperialibacter sp.]|uniref:hypothetical protein n=1 Tax=Imperialibacter sp. TaxID=2038411 RepID=UPI003A85F18A